jgi:AraC-like DNA-binding protein
MHYYTIHPPEMLADYVQFFWVLEGQATAGLPFVHRALADNAPEFIFYYKGQFSRSANPGKEQRTFHSGIYGQTQQFCQFKAEGDFGIFGAYLYPYTIQQLFFIPGTELSNEYADVKTLAGVDGEMLEEKVMLAADHGERVKRVSEFLIARIKKAKHDSPGIVSCIKDVIRYRRSVSIPALAHDCNLSRRQFERRFKDASGFSPKDFLCLVRFNAAIRLSSVKNKSLTEIAMNCGYYDQSHFIHEFSKFSGYSPKQFFKHASAAEDYRATTDLAL